MAIWDFILKIGGVDSKTGFSFYPSALRGHWDTPTFTYDEVQAPKHDGPLATVTEPDLEGKDFVIEGLLNLSSMSGFATATDSLKYAMIANGLTIQVGDWDTRQRTGVLKDYKAVPFDGPVTAARVTMTVRCRNPLAVDISATTPSGTSSADIDCALGTWKSTPVITITGPTSPLQLTPKDSSGTATQDPLVITFPGSITTLVVDMSGTITADGVRKDNYLSSGDFFRLDPRNGGGTRTVKVRASSGSAVAISYNKQWL